MGCVSLRVWGQICGEGEDGEGCEREDRGTDAFACCGAEGGGAFEWGGLCLVHGLGGFKWGLVELEDALAVAVDVGDDGGEHEEEDTEEPDCGGV